MTPFRRREGREASQPGRFVAIAALSSPRDVESSARIGSTRSQNDRGLLIARPLGAGPRPAGAQVLLVSIVRGMV